MKRKAAKTIAVVIFAGLLVATYFLSRNDSFANGNAVVDSRQKEDALKQYGFYLEPVNKEAGITFTHVCPDVDPKLEHIKMQIASMGASVSVCDFDNDGWSDLYFTNSKTGSKNALYRNLHDGKFEDVAEAAGVADVNTKGTGVSMGAVWGDYDNDGFKDLLLYKWGKPELFKNIDGKKFERVTDGSGLPAWVNANSAIWFDFNNDGLLDIFIGGYYREEINIDSLSTTKMMPESFRYANNGGRKYLLMNMGNSKFKDVTEEYGITSTKWVLAAAAADFNGDGFPELYVANDYNVDEFYLNEGGKRFEEKGNAAGVGRIPKSGMSASLGDINNDGNIGVYTTNITEKGILIQGNNYWLPNSENMKDDPSFVNLAQISGIENAGWAYGAQLGDLNNDGYMDLYVANGFISAKKNTSYWYDYSKVTGGNSTIIGDAKNWPDMEGKSQSGYEEDKIWLNNSDGLFEDVSGKVCPPVTYDGRAVAMADLWNRGVLDIIVANQNNIPLVYKNDPGNNNYWIDFDLTGTVSNADAVGAKVMVEWGDGKKQVQVVTGGMGFSSQNQHRLHFGLGESDKADKVTVYWPSGRIDTIENPEVNKLHIIKETK
ncbi:CRTAC1 family protein [Parafilimonas terrae]|uniref:Repeat domain-containing protein n=1 Tax=Parafilimonas terrae TaxID=1465490 RepID=A0A1I5WY39_9BACT|nr:CRTAC1 family protein [Parafilimonas terrae]SFQ24675.1 Repeat domain-containing protein [Parafilimonas terrae]